jgi:Flp pilus assembly protein TadB
MQWLRQKLAPEVWSDVTGLIMLFVGGIWKVLGLWTKKAT